MGTTKKLAIGLGLISGTLLATYLVTGERADKARELLGKATKGIRQRMNKAKRVISDDSEVHYI